MELQDVAENKPMGLEDFVIEQTDISPTINDVSSSHLAASSSMMTGNISIDHYRSVKDNLHSQSSLNAFLEDKLLHRQHLIDQSVEELTSVLMDERKSIEEKTMYKLGVQTIAQQSVEDQNERNEISYTYLSSDSGSYDNDLVDTSRINMSEIIEDVNDRKYRLQTLINEQLQTTEVGTAAKIVDLAEVIVPFAEWLDAEMLYNDLSKEGDNPALLGSIKQKLTELREKVPTDQREEWAKQVISIINENEQVIFPDGNILTKVQFLNNIILADDYSGAEEFFDNFTSVLDVVGAGALVRSFSRSASGAKATKTLNNLRSQARDVVVRAKAQATSIADNIKDVNPEKSRAIHDITSADETGEAAKAFYGVDRESALASDILPETQKIDDSIPNKTVLDQDQTQLVNDIAKRNTGDYLEDVEKIQVQNKMQSEMQHISGMELRKESLVIGEDLELGGLRIQGLYTPKDSGFKTYDDAQEAFLFSFRHLGLTEKDMTIVKRVGEKYVPTTKTLEDGRKALRDEYVRKHQRIPDDLKPAVDYGVRVDFRYEYNIDDVDVVEYLTTKRNWLDAVQIGQGERGSLTQHLLDSASVLHPRITMPAGRAVDAGAGLRKALVNTFSEFSRAYEKMSKNDRAAMTQYINEANNKGLDFTKQDVLARGFTEEQYQTLRVWRESNDLMYSVTNRDLVQTLNARGFQQYRDKSSNTTFFVKPIARNTVARNSEIFDSVDDSLRSYTKEELNKLYEDGGTIAVLTEPMEIGGQTISTIVVRQSPDLGYTRKLAEGDRVLDYRKSYYPVMYDAEHFIYKRVTTSAGDVYEKTIATAKNQQEAESVLSALQKKEPDVEFYYRRDKAKTDAPNNIDIPSFNVVSNRQLSAQRHRGEKLGDIDSLDQVGYNNLLDPLEAVATQIRSLSERVSLRQYLENTKKRWIKMFEPYLDQELLKDKFGRFSFPTRADQIKGVNSTITKEVRDARTMYNYLRGLEHGYINDIDKAWTSLMHSAADVFGSSKLTKLEELANSASQVRPNQQFKTAAFKLLLSLNPLRQAVVQRYQSAQLVSIFPDYMLGKGFGSDWWNFHKARLGLADDAESIKMFEEFKRTGLTEAVDTNNLVRDDMLTMADLSTAAKLRSTAMAPLRFTQQIGFDAAERGVLEHAWLAFRNEAIQQGKKLTPADYDEIAAKARSFTLSMNRAGEMPYNQNALSGPFQFLQFMHKSALMPFTNRTLTRAQRGKLLAFNTVMFGVPTAALTYVYDLFPEESTSRKILEDGFNDLMLNSIIRTISGDDSDIDFGDLAPTEFGGMQEAVYEMFTNGVFDIFTESPSGSLIFGQNPRITDFFKTAGRWLSLRDDYETPGLETEFRDVAISFMNLSSGFSNSFKALYALETETKINSLGGTTDDNVTVSEAIAQFFGFRTRDEEALRLTKEALYKGRDFNYSDSDMKHDVRAWYTELKKMVTRRGDSVKSEDFNQRVITEALRVFKRHEGKFLAQVRSLIRKDYKNQEESVISEIVKRFGLQDERTVRDTIEKLPENENKDRLRKVFQNFLEAVNEAELSDG